MDELFPIQLPSDHYLTHSEPYARELLVCLDIIKAHKHLFDFIKLG